MKIKNQPDFYCGVMFLVTGVAFAWGATNYKVGEAARMGPGYFPLVLGVLMALVGVVVAMKGLGSNSTGNEKIGKWAWRPLGYIISANVVFGLLLAGMPSIGLPAFGMVIAIYALTFIASMAQSNWGFRATLILATTLAIDRKSTRLNSSHRNTSRMPSSA